MGNDFVIENGTLTKYTGIGGDVVIPDGVTIIGTKAFKQCGACLDAADRTGHPAMNAYILQAKNNA